MDEYSSDDLGDDFILIPSSSNSLLPTDTVDYDSFNESDERSDIYRDEISNLELTVSELEKQLTEISTENASLKEQQLTACQPLEDKIKDLKHQNVNLAAIARKCEDKLKRMQKDNHKTPTEVPPATTEPNHITRMFAQQRAKDLANYAQTLLLRDKEIASLQQKCLELADQIGDDAFYKTQNLSLYGEKDELVTLVKQSAKERLVLETQLSRLRPSQEATEQAINEAHNQISQLQEVNTSLKDELKTLQHYQNSAANLEILLGDKTKEYAVLNELNQEISAKLESECSQLKQTENEVIKQQKECVLLQKHAESLNTTIQTECSKSLQLEEKLQLALDNNTQLLNQNTNLREELTQMQQQIDAMMDTDKFSPVTVNDNGTKLNMKVYIAKYNYDPQMYSPNDQPEAELPLSSGDYIIVHGDMDEDGFYNGELIDGRKGLVPSNFIELVSENELVDFFASQSRKADHNTPANCDNTSSSPHHVNPSLTDSAPTQDSGSLDDSHNTWDLSLSDTPVSFDALNKNKKKHIPYPTKLKLERQLNTSILMSWAAPDEAKTTNIQAYHVYHNKKFKTSVRGCERTKALIEDVNCCEIHRVSVRTVTSRGQSDLAQCTLLVGKGATAEPSNLTISNITSTTATLTWLPGDSNCHHVIYLNGSEHKVLKPGCYKHEMTDLQAKTHYALVLQARPHIETISDAVVTNNCRGLSASLNFTTLALNVITAPVNVQVEAGPQLGTLLIMWIPISISPTTLLSTPNVKGYTIYADNVKVTTVAGATNDHAVLSRAELHGMVPSTISVRTLVDDGTESEPCQVVQLAADLIAEMTSSVSKHFQKVTSTSVASTDNSENTGESVPHGVLDHKSLETVTGTDLADDSSHSELSDIEEEEEEDEDKQLPSSVTTQQPVQVSPTPAARTVKPPQRKDSLKLLSTDIPRVVPAIEITRDSSSEKEGSFEKCETDRSAPSTPEKPMSQNPSDIGRQKNVVNSQNDVTQAGSRHGGVKPQDVHDNNVYDKKVRTTRETRQKQFSKTDSMDDPNVNPQSETSNSDEVSMPYNAPVYSGRTNDYTSIDNNQKISQSPSRSKHEPKKYDSPKKSNKPMKPNVGNVTSPDITRLSNGDALNDSSDSIHELESNNIFTKKRIRDDIPESELIDYEDNGDGDSMVDVPDLRPTAGNRRERLFIALFDYDPYTMSPNQETADEEMTFKEGQLIKVFGDYDADGFFYGESGSQKGFVPCNMVSEVQVDDEEIAAQLFKESDMNQNNSTADKRQNHYSVASQDSLLSPSSNPSIQTSVPTTNGQTPHRMISLYDYDPKELSPNVDSELELIFKKGEYINVYGDMDEDGFFIGEINGRRGLVPSNFLQEVSSVASDDEISSLDTPSPIPEPAKRQYNTPIMMEQVTNLDMTPPPGDDKKLKKKGIFAKGKNIFKKLTR